MAQGQFDRQLEECLREDSTEILFLVDLNWLAHEQPLDDFGPLAIILRQALVAGRNPERVRAVILFTQEWGSVVHEQLEIAVNDLANNYADEYRLLLDLKGRGDYCLLYKSMPNEQKIEDHVRRHFACPPLVAD